MLINQIEKLLCKLLITQKVIYHQRETLHLMPPLGQLVNKNQYFNKQLFQSYKVYLKDTMELYLHMDRPVLEKLLPCKE